MKLNNNTAASRMRPAAKREVPELDSKILRWTIEDITTSNLFAKQVGVIPMEFSSTEEYLRVFRVPLLEEVRAQLHQALEKSISVQIADRIITIIIRNIRRPNPAKVLDEDKSSKKILEFHLPSNLGVKTSDLILLCSGAPRWDTKRGRLLKSDSVFVLACVVFVDENSPLVCAAVYVRDGSPILKAQLVVHSVWQVVLPGMNVTPARRIWGAISMPFESKTASRKSVTNTILRIDQQIIPTVSNHSLGLPQKGEGGKTLRCVEDYSNSRGLNESQRDVLKSALAGLLAVHAKPHVRMVQGPPGTGKTTLLVTLISVLGCLQRRTLISAPTNAAVIEVSKRMMRFFDVSKIEETFSDFCSRTQAGLKRCLPISLSDIILNGSKERLQGVVDGTMLEKIFLPCRVDRLQKALNPRTGWKASVQFAVKFLTTAPALYEAQNAETSESDEDHSNSEASKGKKSSIAKKEKKKESKAKKSRTATKEKKEEKQPATFWSFARESTVKLRDQMRKASFVLTSELPQRYMDITTSIAMTGASKLMAALVDLMPVEAPSGPETWFSTPTTTTDTLHEKFTNLNLSSSSSTTGKTRFLQAREAVLEALASSPGCSLFATKEQPKGFVPLPEWLELECLRNATLVFSTVSGAGSKMMKGVEFECGIIDEASQLVEAETTIITRKKGLKQLILVGDHKQLPATVISKIAEKCGYKRSLFDRLQMLQHGCRHMLNIQYRMKPTISHFPNSQFYEGKVKDGPNVMSPAYGNSLHNAAAFGAYAFLDCKHGAEVDQQKGWKNPKEVEVVRTLVTALGKVCAERNLVKLSVGVISPYVMQVEALKQSLDRQVLHGALQVEVKTVDGFQGNERDVIIFSAVRSNHANKIGFLDDCRRLNVAITRGRGICAFVANKDEITWSVACQALCLDCWKCNNVKQRWEDLEAARGGCKSQEMLSCSARLGPQLFATSNLR